jgi:hypothetical protein
LADLDLLMESYLVHLPMKNNVAPSLTPNVFSGGGFA